ncbi:MAG: tetratricopeptide repeat protein [Verrucomicrobiota bacterium]
MGLCCVLWISLSPGVSQEVAQPVRPAPALEEALSYADLLFSRKQFALAAKQYQLFIREQPNSPNLQAAWFRLAECYLKVNQVEDAITSFSYLIETYKMGPFVGSAAYRLGVMRLEQQDYRNALAYFQVAKDELNKPEAVLQARYYYARCLQLTQQAKEALAQFQEILKAGPPEENPFHERSLLESARLYFELGDGEKALKQFTTLADTATNDAFKEEAIVRGGLLAAEAGKPELSEELLQQALKFPDTSPWKSLAQIGAIFNAFSQEDYDRVIGLYNLGTYSKPDESRAKVLLIVGHSYRMNGDIESALRLYTLVGAKYPSQPEGIEAGYRRLQILHQRGATELPEAAEEYAAQMKKLDPANPFIDMAWLMRAEWHFNKAGGSASGPGSDYALKHYTDAANAYRIVRIDNIEEKYREISLYKRGWSEIESGDTKQGVLTLSRFIEKYRRSALASSAVAKKAMAYQAQGDHQFALGDYQDLVKNYPESPELEFAMQQIALILAHQRRIPEMIAAYQDLLKRFPKTEGAGEAYYWIGVGYFDLEEFEQAIPALNKARSMAPNYDDKATLRLVISHYQLEDIDQLSANARRYLENTPTGAEKEVDGKRPVIPPQVLEYLGRKLAASSNFRDAEFFLTAVTDPKNPSQTSASIWKLLADCRSELKRHRGVITATDNFLVQTERPSERASAYLQRGLAQFCLEDYDAAGESARESLRSQKEGRTNAEARILLGDIAAVKGSLEEAARDYLVVSQIFSDREITPKALSKAINAYQALGLRDKAGQLQQQLSSNFPEYDPPEDFNPDC